MLALRRPSKRTMMIEIALRKLSCRATIGRNNKHMAVGRLNNASAVVLILGGCDGDGVFCPGGTLWLGARFCNRFTGGLDIHREGEPLTVR